MSDWVLENADQTRALGAALAKTVMSSGIEQPIVIALNGDLGVGKTTFVSGLLHALGVNGPIRSPTYTLIEPYEVGDRTVYHLDLYRLADSRELEMLAPRDLLNAGAVLLVEWANRGGAALPKADLTLNWRYSNDSAPAAHSGSRALNIETSSSNGKQLADGLNQSVDEAKLSL